MSVRTPLPRWVDVALLPALNVILAFLIGGLIVLAVGQNPLQAVGIMIGGAFGYGLGFGYTLYYTTDFIFAGLAVSLAYHAGMFNIGPEGQAYVGGLGVILVALALNGLHWSLMFPLMIVAGALFGAFWAFIPGVLQAKRGSHIVITTILFNFIAVSLMSYIITRILKPEGVQSDESAPIDAISRIPRLGEFIGLFGRSPVNLTFILAILALGFVYWLVWHSKFGYAMRALGHNPTATRYAGISSSRMIMITMALAGALAAMVAVNNVGSVQGRLILNFVNGAGFVGVAVAFMGKAHPIGVALSALLFGALYQGGQELAFSMPGITKEMIVTIQALVILFTGAMGDMLRIPLERLFARGATESGT
ncbi:sugar ABC transporter permease [Devosia psychrophila]|jgi:simple sugar transport system permease protein|uniref:Nucleoside ABC transporter membrane protein n=1 Tax=Devosia psychrophila TaxID=728005 RepID=A0A0F5PZ38_9HYPH|nr:ABC transporter permease [Devosia psychrophila]KKC33069.1 sugar ABC transporter permease [Devosia psychrophila]SFC82924.1 nucleoside ABC transporter membrane protein [Devosia psychrophila]